MMKYSEQLLSNIREYKKRFFCRYWVQGEFSRAMKFLYHCALPTEDLILEAAAHSTGFLNEYYTRHYDEEQGEIGILKKDLAVLRIDPEEPDAIAMALVGSQYYMIKHVHPVCLLGYMAVSEADPIAIDYVDHLENLYGPLKFLRLHAIKDIEHGKEILELLDSMNPEWQRLVDNSADNALMYYSKVYGR